MNATATDAVLRYDSLITEDESPPGKRAERADRKGGTNRSRETKHLVTINRNCDDVQAGGRNEA